MARTRRPEPAAGASLAFVLLVAALATGCSSTMGLAPVAYPDSEAPCPAGRAGWKLEVLDRRAQRDSSTGVVALIGDSIRRSFPGCRWDSDAGPDAGVLRIEVHRFATNPAGNTWDAAAEWTVTAEDASGARLTEFETNEEVSRPNYRGSNNALESLREVFDRALRRTLAGLRVVSQAMSGRPLAGTAGGEDPATARKLRWANDSCIVTSADQPSDRQGFRMERFSQPGPSEVL